MRNAFAPIVRARPCPIFGRPVRLRGRPHRLQPDTSPHALRIPDRSGHPALRDISSSWLQVRLGRVRLSPSCPFRLLHTRLLSRPARRYPRFRIRPSSSERRGDFNPHDSRAAQRTLRTHPSPSRLGSTSRLSRLYDRPCSDDFSSGRGGLLQLLSMSLSPCCRFHPTEVLEPHRSDFGSPCCLRPPVGGSAFGATHFRGHFCVHCCYGPVTRRLPTGDVVDRLQSFWFPATLLSKLRGF